MSSTAKSHKKVASSDESSGSSVPSVKPKVHRAHATPRAKKPDAVHHELFSASSDSSEAPAAVDPPHTKKRKRPVEASSVSQEKQQQRKRPKQSNGKSMDKEEGSVNESDSKQRRSKRPPAAKPNPPRSSSSSAGEDSSSATSDTPEPTKSRSKNYSTKKRSSGAKKVEAFDISPYGDQIPVSRVQISTRGGFSEPGEYSESTKESRAMRLILQQLITPVKEALGVYLEHSAPGDEEAVPSPGNEDDAQAFNNRVFRRMNMEHINKAMKLLLLAKPDEPDTLRKRSHAFCRREINMLYNGLVTASQATTALIELKHLIQQLILVLRVYSGFCVISTASKTSLYRSRVLESQGFFDMPLKKLYRKAKRRLDVTKLPPDMSFDSIKLKDYLVMVTTAFSRKQAKDLAYVKSGDKVFPLDRDTLQAVHNYLATNDDCASPESLMFMDQLFDNFTETYRKELKLREDAKDGKPKQRFAFSSAAKKKGKATVDNTDPDAAPVVAKPPTDPKVDESEHKSGSE